MNSLASSKHSFEFGAKKYLVRVNYLQSQTLYNSITMHSNACIIIALSSHAATISSDAHSDRLAVVSSSDRSSRTIPSN